LRHDIGDARVTNVPRDLDLKPYKDEHDDKLLRRMAEAFDKGAMPMGFAPTACVIAARLVDHSDRGLS
jgi:hypothetical protein